MGFHIGPRVLRATGGSSDHKDGFRIHHFPPKIVENGLMFNLDFGDKRCDSGDGSTTYHDLSGNGKNFTRSGGYAFTGYAGGVREFDGVNDHIFRNDPELVAGLGPKFTIQFNFLTENSSSRQGLVSSHMNYGGSHQDAIEIEVTASNTVMTGFRRSPGDTFSQVSSGSISTNTWYDIAMVVDGQRIIQYQNGSLIGSTNITKQSVISTPTVNPTLVLGRYAGHYLHGYMGHCRMYNRALSAAEVLRNYNATRIRHINTDWTDTFTPTCSGQKGKVEVLVVGAGGNGGMDVGGGGGGAQVTHDPSLTVTSGTSITATVGNHRIHSSGNDQTGGTNQHGANGRSSSFSTLTALGGNGGSGRTGTKSTVGMHGGGASYSYPAVTSPSGGGNAGGASNNTGANSHGSGGGGGAGSVGEAGIGGTKAGNGGDGVVYDISGEPVAYGAGGGGSYYQTGGSRGLGGSGTGGDGGAINVGNGPGANNGRHGTGSGGGGAHSNGTYGFNGGHGGHGTVIIRYPAEEYEVEVLVVAGGGGGGRAGVSGSDPGGGGGGGGGVVFKSVHKVLSGKNYPVNVGNGGKGGSSNSSDSHAPNGVNSVFDDIIAIGGGGGGKTNSNGFVGGSGGGGGGNSGEGAVGTPQQGNAGGDPHSDGGGGGGGAGAAGSDGGEGTGGHGGAGKTYTISGSSVTYGGGGGGGARQGNNIGQPGSGNGGAGSVSGVGGSGTDGRGGGGGGTSTGASGGDGGSGVVIVAYKGPQRGEGGTVSTTARSGYTTHTFTDFGDDTYTA